jgi:hypothetical protein
MMGVGADARVADRQGAGRSVLATFVLAYLAVLILLFAVAVPVEFRAARTVEKELERANSALFSNG